MEHPYGERTEAEDAWSECMATEVKPLQERIKQLEARMSELETDLKNTIDAGKIIVRNELAAKADLDFLRSRIKEELEKMVCTEGEDAGVFFLSPESESKYDPKLNCHVYKHEHFSELGDALIGLWKIVSPEDVPEGGK